MLSPINEFNLEEYMEDCDISGCLQERADVKYVWPGLTILDIAKTKEYEFDFVKTKEHKMISKDFVKTF